MQVHAQEGPRHGAPAGPAAPRAGGRCEQVHGKGQCPVEAPSLSSQFGAEHNKWPAPPISTSPFLGSRAQKLGCFCSGPAGSGAWPLPRFGPGFCLPVGSPARGSARPLEATRRLGLLISQICLPDGHRELSVPVQQTPPGPPNIIVMSRKHFPSQERDRGQKRSWPSGDSRQRFCFGDRAGFHFLSHVHA